MGEKRRRYPTTSVSEPGKRMRLYLIRPKTLSRRVAYSHSPSIFNSVAWKSNRLRNTIQHADHYIHKKKHVHTTVQKNQHTSAEEDRGDRSRETSAPLPWTYIYIYRSMTAVARETDTRRQLPRSRFCITHSPSGAINSANDVRLWRLFSIPC